MITSSTPTKGVSSDVTLLEHDPDFARDSVNGRFATVNGNFTWEADALLKSHVEYASTEIINAFDFEEMTYFFLINTSNNYFLIVRYDKSSATPFTTMFARYNDLIGVGDDQLGYAGLEWKYLVKTCSFWRSANGSKLKVYFSDGHYTQPVCIDLLETGNSSLPREDFQFSPMKEIVRMELESIQPGGNLTCGKRYYAVKAYKKSGLSTDWVFLHNPIEIPNSIPTSYSPSDYQYIEGGSANRKSNAKVNFIIWNYSSFPGWNVKVVSFLVIGENKIDAGNVFYDGPIQFRITHTSDVCLETVLFENAIQSSITVKGIGYLATNGEINVIADVKTDEFIQDPVYGNITNLKFKPGWRPTAILKKYVDYSPTQPNLGLVIDAAKATNIENFQPPAIGQKQAQNSVQFSDGALTNLRYRKGSYLAANPNAWTLGNSLIASPGFYDYTNPQIAYHRRVYRIGEEVRFALVPFSMYGKPMRPIWLCDLTRTSEGNIPGCILSSYGTSTSREQRKFNGHFFVQSDDYQVLKQDFNWVELKNVHLDDFVDTNGPGNYIPKISGFSIVQAEPRVKRIVTEGFFTRILVPSKNEKAIVPYIRSDGAKECKEKSGGGWLLFYSPDVFFDNKQVLPGQKIYITQKINSANVPFIKEWKTCQHIQKLYYGNASNTTYEGEVEAAYELPFFPETETLDIEGLGTIRNQPISSNGRRGVGNKKAILIKLKSGSTLYNAVRDDLNISTADIDYYVGRIENNGWGFDGSTDTDLEATTYRFIGHYQPVNSSFFSAIYDLDNGYMCDVAVYGGQYYGSIFEAMRVIPYKDYDGWRSNTVYLPVITDFNLRMRSGTRHSKNRIIGHDGDVTNNDGVGVVDSKGQWEDLLLNVSYKESKLPKECVPIPENFEISDRIRNAVYWSTKQALQGDEDTFRKFYPNVYMMADGTGKYITGLDFGGNRLYVFQDRSIGFMPYNERLLAAMDNSNSLIVSYGSIFPKYESISRMKGLASTMHKKRTVYGLFFIDSFDKTLNVMEDTSIKELGSEIRIASLIRNGFSSPVSMQYDQINKRLLILSATKKVLDISLNPLLVNGYHHYDQANTLGVFSFGDTACITNRNVAGSLSILSERSDGSVNLSSQYMITLIVGSKNKDMMNKIFDNVIIHTKEDFYPTSIKYTAGNRVAEESLLNNRDVLINGSLIQMNTPFVLISNGAGIRNRVRLADYPICIIELTSANRFALESLLCEYRNTK